MQRQRHIIRLRKLSWQQEREILNAAAITVKQPPRIGVRNFVAAVMIEVVFLSRAMPIDNKISIVLADPTSQIHLAATP